MPAVKLFDRRRRDVERAARLRRAGDAAAAVELLAEILTAEPDHVAANAEMGRSLRLLDDPAGAEAHLRRALAAVLDYTLICELAAAFAEQRRVDEAEEYVDAALFMAAKQPRLDPGEALIVRAVIAHAQGRDDDALAALDAVEPKRARPATRRQVARIRESIAASREAAPVRSGDRTQPQPEGGDRG